MKLGFFTFLFYCQRQKASNNDKVSTCTVRRAAWSLEARARLLQREVVVGRPGLTAVAISVDSQIFKGEGDFRVLLSVLSLFFNFKILNLIYFCYYLFNFEGL